MMAAALHLTLDSDFFNKYATLDYYLSRGASGNVYGPIQWHGLQLAIKQVMFADGKVTDEFKKNIEVKKDIWTSLKHKHLMRIHSVDLTRLPKGMFILMEYAAGGSLYKTIRLLGSESKLPIDVVTDWAKQIAEGMLYLHEKNIVHRDLKSSNILLMEPFAIYNSHTMVTLRIADFDDVKEHDHTTTMSLVGTCAYMAPEVLRNQWFSKASDVWSYGVVIWEMLSGDIPHKELEERQIIYKAMNGQLDKLPLQHSFPEEYKLLLNKCWKSAFRERPPLHEIFCVLERIDKYKSDPVLIETIKRKDADEESKSIEGLAILDKELFVVSGESSEIEVFDSIKLCYRRRWKLKELIDPVDIVSCNKNKCLYIVDRKGFGELSEILRVDPNGELIKNWSIRYDWGCGLSVTYESNVILTVLLHKLSEYSPDGQLIRTINLSSDDGIRFPWHAVKLTNGHFVVSHGYYVHRVCLVDGDGKLIKSFGGEPGSNIGQMNRPVHLTVDGDGFVLVVDQGNHRILLLDSNLEFKREILSKEKHGLRSPCRILLDDSSSQTLVAERHWGIAGRILIFQL